MSSSPLIDEAPGSWSTLRSNSERQREAHLFAFRSGIQRVFGRHVDDSGALRAKPFEGAAALDIIRLAGDPEAGHAVPFGQGNDQAAGSFGVPMSTMRRVYGVTDVSGKADDVLTPTHPQ